MNLQLFTDALRKYLLSKNVQVDKDAALIQQHLDYMDNNSKRGIWQHVGKILKVNRSAAHNYYHNTWTTQFFDSLKSYRKEIKQMVFDNRNMSNQDLVQKFASMFPEKKFSKHSLQQVVYIQKQRLGFTQNSDNVSFIGSEEAYINNGFSIDISECVRFLDAVSM
ncbi:Conserved_hypothetical protein [Hexamita inflata]|uniref:Uncharacterized protein n=1 Tax=Hexamita inflata TaxID=28002 RepID=A0AA86TV74_9EUKA|nr:Conserved hypothetical protein [Hexamita inflata]CAI9929914.1 Conserved hypothetical protein [Hexamita inflata]CAI9929919.1 Conserved hypothetical protein [Hexamita inflata]